MYQASNKSSADVSSSSPKHLIRKHQSAKINERLRDLETAYELDPEQITLRKFPHHKIGMRNNASHKHT